MELTTSLRSYLYGRLSTFRDGRFNALRPIAGLTGGGSNSRMKVVSAFFVIYTMSGLVRRHSQLAV